MKAAMRGLPLLWVLFVAWVFFATPKQPHIASTLTSELAAAGASLGALAAGPTDTGPGPLPTVVALLMLAVFLFATATSGRWLRRKFIVEGLDPALGLALDTSLGLGMLAYLVMILGLTHLLYVPLLALCPVVLLVVGRREASAIIALLREVRLFDAGRKLVAPERARRDGKRKRTPDSPKPETSPPSLTARVLLVVIILLGVGALIRNLFPPTSAEWDSLVYHLTGPKLFIGEHRIYHVEHDHHMGFPFTMEMLYLLGLALQGWRLAKLFHLATYFLCGLAIFGAVRDKGASRVPALAAAACFLSVPVAAWEASTAYIDLGLALYTLLCIVLFGRFMRTRERGALILAGMACGLALAIKMTGAIVLGFAGVALVVAAVRDSSDALALRLRRGLGQAALVCGIAAVVASPWYIKTAVHTGNPVFPFFYEVFGGRDWTQGRADDYKAEQQSHGLHQLARTLDTGPFAMQRTLASKAVRAVLRKGDPPTAAGIVLAPILQVSAPDAFWEHPAPWSIMGPIFLALLPLLARRRPLPAVVSACTAYVCLGVVAWVYLSQLSRYLLPVLACAAVGVGHVLTRERDVVTRSAWVLVASSLLCFTLLTSARALISLPGALGLWSMEDVTSQTLESYSAFVYLNENARPETKVALYGEPRAFSLDVPFFFADSGHNMFVPYETLSGADDLLAALRGLGATHVLVNPRFHPGVLEPGSSDRISQMLTQLADSGKLVLVHGRPPRETMVFAIAEE